jgi:hypothetical protein
MYDGLNSTGLMTKNRDSIHYDTNLEVSVANDSGQHGLPATFRETRNQVILGNSEDYTVAIVRGGLTTNNIPLFCPRPSDLITENGTQQWEVTAQPGLALTWTGPVYQVDGTSGVTSTIDQSYVAWPVTGAISWYTAPTLPANGAVPVRSSGFIDLSVAAGQYGSSGYYGGGSNDCPAAIAAGRLAAALSAATGFTITCTATSSGSAAMTQTYAFTNANTVNSVYLDFNLPSYQQQNNSANGSVTVSSVKHPSKQAILSACKILGFIPGTVFQIPANSASSSVSAPRAYQLAFRSTMNLYSYKNVRWVVEDQGVTAIPSAVDVARGDLLSSKSYFDCYSYQHFLNNCINPTFQRLIYDQFDNTVSAVNFVITSVASSGADVSFGITGSSSVFQVGQQIQVSSLPVIMISTTNYSANPPVTTTTTYNFNAAYFVQAINGRVITCNNTNNVPFLATTTSYNGSALAGSLVILTPIQTPLSNQCLTRQLETCCWANCNTSPWLSGVTYVSGAKVHYYGHAYYAVYGSTGQPPLDNTSVWLDCGASILASWTPGTQYAIGDTVTWVNGSTPSLYTATGTPTGAIPSQDTGNWTSVVALQATAAAGLTANIPAIGTAAPVLTFNSTNQLFSLNLDSYGFGGTSSQNVDDGYGGYIDDAANNQANISYFQQANNAALNDLARDSWGLTGTAVSTTPAYTTYRHPFTVYDEKFNVEADDYFHQLFGNWPTMKLIYTDPQSQLTTSYVRYFPQAVCAGLTVSNILPLQVPTTVTSGYLPYGRVAGNQPYLYVFPQDYPSVGLMWNPVDTIVVLTQKVPLVDDLTGPPCILTDGIFNQAADGQTRKILGEFIVKVNVQLGQEYRSEIIFEPQSVVRVPLQSGGPFVDFDYTICMRMKGSNYLRVVSLSNGGSAFMRFEFELKH